MILQYGSIPELILGSTYIFWPTGPEGLSLFADRSRGTFYWNARYTALRVAHALVRGRGVRRIDDLSRPVELKFYSCSPIEFRDHRQAPANLRASCLNYPLDVYHK